MLASEPLLDFLHSAKAYCAFLETESSDEKLFLKTVQRLLLKLYLTAPEIPNTDGSNDYEPEVQLTEKRFTEIFDLTEKNLNGKPWYRVMFDPTAMNFEEEPVLGDLHDDLTDIYKDIKQGLLVFELENEQAKAYAIWHLKWNFWNHWADHAADAIRVLHYILEKTEKYNW